MGLPCGNWGNCFFWWYHVLNVVVSAEFKSVLFIKEIVDKNIWFHGDLAHRSWESTACFNWRNQLVNIQRFTSLLMLFPSKFCFRNIRDKSGALKCKIIMKKVWKEVLKYSLLYNYSMLTILNQNIVTFIHVLWYIVHWNCVYGIGSTKHKWNWIVLVPACLEGKYLLTIVYAIMCALKQFSLVN